MQRIIEKKPKKQKNYKKVKNDSSTFCIGSFPSPIVDRQPVIFVNNNIDFIQLPFADKRTRAALELLIFWEDIISLIAAEFV